MMDFTTVCRGEWEEVTDGMNTTLYCTIREKCKRFKGLGLELKTFFDIVPWKIHGSTGECPHYQEWIFER